MHSNCPKKYCVEHAKHASKVYLETDKCNHCIIKLKNNSLLKRDQCHFDGKGSEGQKLTIVSVVKWPAKNNRSVCQCRRLTLACWVLRRYKFDPNQHKTSENNKCIVSHSSCTINDPNLEWSVLLTPPCAARSTRVYLERGGAPRCTSVHNIRQRAIPTHYRRSRSILNPLRHTDPWFRSNLLV